MKVKLSKRSIENLRTCHHELITLFTVAAMDSPIDFSIICGYRNKEDQEKAFNSGNSRVHFPGGKHNKFPSLAADVIPYPVDWKDYERFKLLSDHVLKTAKSIGIKILYPIIFNNGTIDYPHYQLAEE